MPCIGRSLACVLALCAIGAPAALADTVSGTLELTHEDTAAGPRPISILSTSDGPQVVHFAPGEPIPPNGAEVRLHGTVNGSTIEADSATIIGPAIAVPTGVSKAVTLDQGTPLAAGVARKVAIVVITFAGGTAPAYTDAQLQGVLVSSSNSVSNYFSEQSYGQVSFTGINSPNGDVYHVSIAANGSGCNTNGGWPTWGSQARSAVGSVLNGYDHVIYVFDSHNTCGWAGLGYMPGSEVYIDNAFTLNVVAHELGHNLGVHHASSLRCIVGGQPVAYSTTANACSFSEYGDPYDIMGSSATNQQNAFHKLQSGWLGSVNGPRVKTITTSGDYTVSPLEQSSGVALLLVPNVTGAVVGGSSLGQDFALDLRQTYGSYFDAFAAGSAAIGGVQIRLVQAPGSGSPIQTQLIDNNPQTATFADARSRAGKHVHGRHQRHHDPDPEHRPAGGRDGARHVRGRRGPVRHDAADRRVGPDGNGRQRARRDARIWRCERRPRGCVLSRHARRRVAHDADLADHQLLRLGADLRHAHLRRQCSRCRGQRRPGRERRRRRARAHAHAHAAGDTDDAYGLKAVPGLAEWQGQKEGRQGQGEGDQQSPHRPTRTALVAAARRGAHVRRPAKRPQAHHDRQAQDRRQEAAARQAALRRAPQIRRNELLLLGRSAQRERRALTARHRLCEQVEPARTDLALVARRRVAAALQLELVLL